MSSRAIQALGVVLNQTISNAYLVQHENEMNIHTSALISAARRGLAADDTVHLFIHSLHERDIMLGLLVPEWFDEQLVEDDIFVNYFTSRGFCVFKHFVGPGPGGLQMPDRQAENWLAEYEVARHPCVSSCASSFDRLGNITNQAQLDRWGNVYFPAKTQHAGHIEA